MARDEEVPSLILEIVQQGVHHNPFVKAQPPAARASADAPALELVFAYSSAVVSLGRFVSDNLQ